MSQPHPWLQPLHRRVITIAACVGWLVFELTQGQSIWLFLAIATTGYGVWELFLSGNYASRE